MLGYGATCIEVSLLTYRPLYYFLSCLKIWSKAESRESATLLYFSIRLKMSMSSFLSRSSNLNLYSLFCWMECSLWLIFCWSPKLSSISCSTSRSSRSLSRRLFLQPSLQKSTRSDTSRKERSMCPWTVKMSSSTKKEANPVATIATSKEKKSIPGQTSKGYKLSLLLLIWGSNKKNRQKEKKRIDPRTRRTVPEAGSYNSKNNSRPSRKGRYLLPMPINSDNYYLHLFPNKHQKHDSYSHFSHADSHILRTHSRQAHDSSSR